jgi:hypothetical protein
MGAAKNADLTNASSPAESVPKKAASTTKTSRKRKGNADATPSKRGRKQKDAAVSSEYSSSHHSSDASLTSRISFLALSNSLPYHYSRASSLTLNPYLLAG